MANIRGVVAMLIGWPLTAAYMTCVLGLQTLCLRHFPERAILYAIRVWGRSILRLAGVRITEVNPSTVQGPGPRVVIINHQSFLDILAFSAILPGRPLVLAKKEYKYLPIVNWTWWTMRWLLVDRHNTARDVQTMDNVAAVLVKDRRSLCLAPEGTRSAGEIMLPFKKGAFHVALATHAPVCPIVFVSAGRLMPKGAFFPKAGTIFVKYLDPVDTHHWTRENLENHVQQTHAMMVEAYKVLAPPLG